MLHCGDYQQPFISETWKKTEVRKTKHKSAVSNAIQLYM